MNKDLSLKEVGDIIRGDFFLINKDNKKSLYQLRAQSERTGTIKKALVHYQTGNDEYTATGHWCAIIINPTKHSVYFFDSFGDFPDSQISKIPMRYREMTGQVGKEIGKFLYDCYKSGYDVRYNEVKLQDDKSSVCGRYCGIFLRHESEPEVLATIVTQLAKKHNMTPDEIILAATS